MPEDRAAPTDEQAGSDAEADRVTPGEDDVAAVPAPGYRDSSAGAGVRTAQGASPEGDSHASGTDEASDAAVTSPGAWTSIAAPGKPDGEVDTRG